MLVKFKVPEAENIVSYGIYKDNKITCLCCGNEYELTDDMAIQATFIFDNDADLPIKLREVEKRICFQKKI